MKAFGPTVGTFEAKTHFSELIDCVLSGETITITRNGMPVAEIRPIGDQDSSRVESIIKRLQERRTRVKPDPDGWTVEDYLEKGRRC